MIKNFYKRNLMARRLRSFKNLRKHCMNLYTMYYGYATNDLGIKNMVTDEKKRNEVLDSLRMALFYGLLDEEQKVKMKKAVRFLGLLKKSTKKNISQNYSRYCWENICDSIRKRYSDILNIEEYVSEYNIAYFICKTKDGRFRPLHRNGDSMQVCPSWKKASDECEKDSGYIFDNWITRESDPYEHGLEDSYVYSIENKLRLYQISAERYSTLSKHELMDIFNALCEVDTLDARRKCDIALEFHECA